MRTYRWYVSQGKFLICFRLDQQHLLACCYDDKFVEQTVYSKVQTTRDSLAERHRIHVLSPGVGTVSLGLCRVQYVTVGNLVVLCTACQPVNCQNMVISWYKRAYMRVRVLIAVYRSVPVFNRYITVNYTRQNRLLTAWLCLCNRHDVYSEVWIPVGGHVGQHRQLFQLAAAACCSW